jgi:hypothetical protein
MRDFNKEEYNKMCAEFLGWELHLAKTALNWQDGTFMDWDDEEEFWIENPTEEFKQFRIVCHPEEVGLGYDFKLFKSYHYESGLKFDSDWNWIMEVLEKITKIGWNWELIDFNGTVKEEKCFKCSIFNLEFNTPFNKFSFESSNSKEAIVHTIRYFLNWYKENKE